MKRIAATRIIDPIRQQKHILKYEKERIKRDVIKMIESHLDEFIVDEIESIPGSKDNRVLKIELVMGSFQEALALDLANTPGGRTRRAQITVSHNPNNEHKSEK